VISLQVAVQATIKFDNSVFRVITDARASTFYTINDYEIQAFSRVGFKIMSSFHGRFPGVGLASRFCPFTPELL